jgi:RNA polymerase sigma-70 factor (ECF subfamily)
MELQNKKSKEIEEIIERFSEFIGANIQKFNPQKAGIDANDIAQEVKIKLWKMLQSEKKIKYYSSFISKVVYSTTIDVMRKLKREKEILANYQSSGEEKNPSPDISHQQELNQIIGHAVDSLIEPRRKVIKLYLLGMDLEETAIFFGWTRDKVRNLLYRGIGDLKVILREKGLDYESK